MSPDPPAPPPPPPEITQPAPPASNPPQIQPIVSGTVNFGGRPRTIIYQREAGVCPLVAICNVLSLQNRIELDPSSDIVLDFLVELVSGVLSSSTATQEKSDVAARISAALGCVNSLGKFLNVNLHFTRIDGFENTAQRDIFTLLDIPLYHGWLVEPGSQIANIIGLKYRDTLEAEYLHYKSTEQNDTVDNAVDSADATSSYLPVPQGGPCANSQWNLVYELLQGYGADQITDYGLKCLKDEVGEGELCVLFQKDHFHTMFKKRGHLYLLLSNANYKGADAVWVELSDVHGGGRLMTSNFTPIVEHNSLNKQNADDYAGTSTLGSHFLFDEDLARKVQFKEYQQNQDATKQKKMGSRSDRTESGSSRKPIPNSKLVLIERLLREQGGKKISADMILKNKDMRKLRDSLDFKGYEETFFSDWFEPHNAEEIANRLKPTSVEGKLTPYAFAEVPEIVYIIRGTSSNSSETLPMPLNIDVDSGDEVDQNTNPQPLEHQEGVEKSQKDVPRSTVNIQSKSMFPHQAPPNVDADNSGDGVDENRAPEPLEHQEGVENPQNNVPRSTDNTHSRSALPSKASGRRTQRIAVATPGDPRRRRKGIANPKDQRKGPYGLRQIERQNYSGKPAALNKRNGPYNLRKITPKKYCSGKSAAFGKRRKRAGTGTNGEAGKLPLRDRQPVDEAGVDPTVSDNLTGEAGNPSLGDPLSVDEAGGEAGNPPLGDPLSVDEAGGEAGNPPLGDPLPVDEAGLDPPMSDNLPETGAADFEEGADQQINQFIGYQHHKVSFEDLNKESLRFESMFTVLPLNEYCCILLNPTHFDRFTAKRGCEFGVGVVEAEEVQTVINRYLDKYETHSSCIKELGPYKIEISFYYGDQNCHPFVAVFHFKLGDTHLIHAFRLEGPGEKPNADLVGDLESFRKKLKDTVGKYIEEKLDGN
ncbi:unnamed protein product [Urochloa humidicola]